MFLVAGTVVVALLMGAVAVDLSSVAARGQTLQNAADAAALAGVQAYRETAGDEAAATAAVEDLLIQNGIELNGSVSYDVEFPDPNFLTQVQVSLLDDDPNLFLAGVTGVMSEIERSATAEFRSCAVGCGIQVEIPPPFDSIDAAGSGDGYKPIRMGSRFYALNHNSTSGDLVCVDVATDAGCWDNGDGVHQASDVVRGAYNGSSQVTPEMPQTAVYETRIYWAGSTSLGTFLYCYETATDTPCSQSTTINALQRGTNNDPYNPGDLKDSRKDRNRASGTVLAGNQIYVFTDDHRVHCFDPSINLGGGTVPRCLGTNASGDETQLGLGGFPAGDPLDGNHGSSIDRVVDPATGYIYSTLHIRQIPTQIDCSVAPDDVNAMVGVPVVLANQLSGELVTINDTRDGITSSTDELALAAQWFIVPMGTPDDRVAFLSATAGPDRFIDADGLNLAQPEPLDLSGNVATDDQWLVRPYSATTVTIKNYATNFFFQEFYMKEGVDVTGAYGFTTGSLQNQLAEWTISPAGCSTQNPPSSSTLTLEPGTWLHCWDSVNHDVCPGFVPSAIHGNADRFSGRLFFYYSDDANPAIEALCSSGFEDSIGPADFEITCVSHVDGADAQSLADTLSWLEANTAYLIPDDPNNPAVLPGSWGDPHYNRHQNRLFYPTEHRAPNSRVLCWDFDDQADCGIIEGVSAQFGTIEDYGFVSDDTCVVGFGHHAVFWAFAAEDIYEPCTGSSVRSEIQPCNCSGEWKWGTLEFDVDVQMYTEFFVQVENSNGDVVYPTPDPLFPDDPGHSLHQDGTTIDLNFLPVSNDPANDFLSIVVIVDTDNNPSTPDPWANGPQTFTVEFERTPHLTD